MVPWLHLVRLMVRMAGLAVLLLAGCPAGGDDADTDGGVDATRLTITWSAMPTVPGPVATGLTVQELHITYSSVRLIGDAAPGDARTSQGDTEIEWDASRAPSPIEFPQAPPGRYERLELGVGGGNETFAIHGTIVVDGTPTRFEIEDEWPNPVTIEPLGVDLPAGASKTIPLVIELAPVLDLVPFADLPLVNGELTLHRSDPRMGPVRTAMAAAVRVATLPVH